MLHAQGRRPTDSRDESSTGQPEGASVLIRTNHRYEAKVEDLVHVMTDEHGLRTKFEGDPEGGLLSYSREDVDGGIHLVLERVVRFPLTASAAKLLVPEPRFRQVEDWEPEDIDGRRHAVLQLFARDLPIRAVGHLVLSPEPDGGSRVETTVDFSCDVPVIGGRILDAVACGARHLMEADFRANERALLVGLR
jgi:hypothetical protein